MCALRLIYGLLFLYNVCRSFLLVLVALWLFFSHRLRQFTVRCIEGLLCILFGLLRGRKRVRGALEAVIELTLTYI